jgi:hypothetical protein
MRDYCFLLDLMLDITNFVGKKYVCIHIYFQEAGGTWDSNPGPHACYTSAAPLKLYSKPILFKYKYFKT